MSLTSIRQQIIDHNENAIFTIRNWEPIYTAHKDARVLIIGQAPGIRAQESGTPWNDPSGDNLRSWLGVERETFYDQKQFALVPMDFYFPGSGERGDMPPRKGFAERWHPDILAAMPNIQLTLLIGQYAQAHYLGAEKKRTLTETVQNYAAYGPEYFPLVHPSPRNAIWQKKNPWFKAKVVPTLQKRIEEILLAQ